MLKSKAVKNVIFLILMLLFIILSSGILTQISKAITMIIVAYIQDKAVSEATSVISDFELSIIERNFKPLIRAFSNPSELSNLDKELFSINSNYYNNFLELQKLAQSLIEKYGNTGSIFVERAEINKDQNNLYKVPFRVIFEKNKNIKLVLTLEKINENNYKLLSIKEEMHTTLMQKTTYIIEIVVSILVIILALYIINKWMNTKNEYRNEFLKQLFLYEALTIGVVIVLFPFFWMFATAFKPSGTELVFNERNPFDVIPQEPTLSNFRKVLKLDKKEISTLKTEAIFESKNNFSTYFLNSLFISTTAAFLVTLISSMAAYVFSKKELPYKNVIFAFLLATMMIPGLMYMIPQFFMICKMGLMGTKIAMFLPHLASVFGVFMVKQYLDTIPDSLLEAARIDGASEWQCFTIIIVPLAMPILLTLFLLTFLFHWSNFLWQLIVTDFANPLSITLPVGLALFRGQYTSEIGQIMAASCFSIIPIAILFILAQKYFIEGMTQGAVKE